MSVAREKSVLEKKTLVRSYLPVIVELALERYMEGATLNKGEALEALLMESETFKRELEATKEFYNY